MPTTIVMNHATPHCEQPQEFTTRWHRFVRNIRPLRTVVRQLREARDRAVDARWNVNTTTMPPDAPHRAQRADSEPYETIWYPVLRRLLRPLHATPEDVVFDVGSGLGRPLFMFARRGVKRCIGIEASPTLAAASTANASRLRGKRAPIEIRRGDAAVADYSGGTIYCFFNPFGPETLRAALSRIHATVRESPRRVQIAYFNPFHNHVLATFGWLRPVRRTRPVLHTIVGTYWIHEPESRRGS